MALSNDPRDRAVVTALALLTTTPHIVAYLKETDPKALAQARKALDALADALSSSAVDRDTRAALKRAKDAR